MDSVLRFPQTSCTLYAIQKTSMLRPDFSDIPMGMEVLLIRLPSSKADLGNSAMTCSQSATDAAEDVLDTWDWFGTKSRAYLFRGHIKGRDRGFQGFPKWQTSQMVCKEALPLKKLNEHCGEKE
jgi:hypothetical protein